MVKLRGFIYGLSASACFGFIPLFSVPLIAEGMDVASILTYRLFFAAAGMALLMLVRGDKFRIGLAELSETALLGIGYFFSALLLFEGYKYLSSGMATVLHFTYPIFVSLVMHFGFRQYISPVTMVAIALAMSGIILMTNVSDGITAAPPLSAVVMVALSGAAYAANLVLINNRPRLRKMNNRLMTLYMMLSGGVYFLVYTVLTRSGMQIPQGGRSWGLLVLLAVVPTLFSNLLLISALKHAGSTLVSVLGAMEPLTAVLLGIIFFGERVGLPNGIGMGIVVIAVALIILSPALDKGVRFRLLRFSRRRVADERGKEE